MDLNANLLWALSSYDPPLVHLGQLLGDRHAFILRDDVWKLAMVYVDHRRRILTDNAGLDVEIPAETQRQVREMGSYQRRVVITNCLLHYARLLAEYGPYGDAPWRRAARLVEQFHDEWRNLELEKATSL